ncbi:hypothetical protein SAMN05444673_4095 [Bacillus sp. OV166]|uniref:hypothetical protein n=1 Tax=Bacillus sp. OV166 TaxID=1882763 RepID=UPI000A2ABA7E|nr:hypothetical protein [Bacillus sp. OV166]SMQ81022.1 hypothetical protein SAMN05444673_4095 [Bacillus sp. OV166]
MIIKVFYQQNETDDLLETWGDLSYIVINQAADQRYRITLIGYPIEVFVLKKDGQFYFEINEGNKLVNISTSFPLEELMDSIVKGYRNFIGFCKKDSLTFSESTIYKSSINTFESVE